MKNTEGLGQLPGFTLLEMMIVVLIIGVMGMIGIPKYYRSVERSKGSEPIRVLGALGLAEDRYKHRNNVYTADFSLLDVDAPIPTPDWGAPANTAGSAAMTRVGGGVGACPAAWTMTYTFGAVFPYTVTAGCEFALP